MRVEINKSPRHSKITGNFAEALVLYWLSKHGFECALVDHTGLDIIARNPHTYELMGISVKSRSRNEGREKVQIKVDGDNFDKLAKACKAFGCHPYFAIVVDAANLISVFILPDACMRELSSYSANNAYWKMSESALERYARDDRIVKFTFTGETVNWWPIPKSLKPRRKIA
jgi:Holliday junction resolvase